MKTKVKVSATEYFIVRSRTSGGEYLTVRKNRNGENQTKYRWTKDRRNCATRLTSYDAAQKARQRYGGDVIRCVKVTIPDAGKATFQSVVTAR